MAASCDLGDVFDASVRCTVLVLCSCALIAKKCIDGPDRRWDDFALDASKQLLGAGWAHLLAQGGPGLSNVADCGDRWMQTVLGATVGVLVEYLLLNAIAAFLDGVHGDTGDYTIGEYRDLDDRLVPEKYLKQLGVWLGCVLAAVCVEDWLVWEFSATLQGLSAAVLVAVSWSPGLELAFVGVLTPCCLGVAQAWLTDDFLRLGGIPVSEVLAAFAAKAWEHKPLPSWAVQPGLNRPLLLEGASQWQPQPQLQAHPQANGGCYFSAVSPSTIEDGKCNWDAHISPIHSSFVRDSPARNGRRARFEQEEPAQTHMHPELQAALEGMQFQVARAIGASPSPLAEETVDMVMRTDPFFKPRSVRISAAEEAESPGGGKGDHAEEEGESPERQDHKARVTDEDAVLQRLRDQLARVDATVSGLRAAGPGGLGAARAAGAAGGSAGGPASGPALSPARRARLVVEQPGSAGTRDVMDSTHDSSEGSPQIEVLARPAEDMQLARPERPPPLAAGVAAAPTWEPVEQTGVLLDGKIAALEAKIGRLNPPQRQRQLASPVRNAGGDGVIDQFLTGPRRLY